jgi:hydrogenase maturation protease
MNLELAKQIADAVLYEGYILYPYRASALKNRQRFNFGVLMPRQWAEHQQAGESGRLQAECLIEGDAPTIEVRVRFLQLVSRQMGRARSEPSPSTASPPDGDQLRRCYDLVPELEVDGQIYQRWEEALDREIVTSDLPLPKLVEAPFTTHWASEARESAETLINARGETAGAIVRRQAPIEAVATILAQRLGERLWKLRIVVENVTSLAVTASRPAAQVSSLASAHLLLAAKAGAFVSLLEPEEEHAESAAGCQNVGVWPVLVGAPGDRDLVLAAPIILYDYPQVAPESDGNYFDGTEMDEMLALRVMTMTDDEKRAMRSLDPRAREILERTEALSQSGLMHLHGTIRGLKEVSNP